MAVIHEGWKLRTKGKKADYRLVNPTYIPIQAQQALITLEERVLDKVNCGMDRLVKGPRDSMGAKSGSFPATRNGTKGYAKLFRELQKL